MNRGEPLKRRTALKRTQALDRVSAPLRRSKGLAQGNGRLARSRPETASKPAKPPKRKASIPKRVREHVYARERGRCVKCRREVGRGLFERALHHVLPEREWPEFVKLAANVVLVCAGCHDEHERAHRRIALTDLPGEVRSWLDEQLQADGAVFNYVTRTYAGTAA